MKKAPSGARLHQMERHAKHRLTQLLPEMRNHPLLARAMFDALGSELHRLDFPPLIETTAGEPEPTPALQCPWCSAVQDWADGLAVEDWAIERTYTTNIDHEARTVRFSYDHEGDFSTLNYLCGTCQRPVTLPECWEEA